ncbi:MAG TPA: hypothetical protein VKZ83_07295 [Phototrophicaceae bacterium]|nr:hypothetical protein [Phototrophicaceae bacterium]
MSLADAPQWLVSAFVRSAVAVGACADREEIKRTASALVERWQEPDRKFHNLRHLIDVLARVEELAEETHVPDVVRLAAWYHGAVFSSSAQVAYARRGGEDEVASAELARTELTALGVPEDVVERVAELILDLARHDADERDVDALALCDADLGTLAVEPQRYTAYRKAIREEYAHIPEEDYVASRIAILTRLLQRRRLFVSPFSLAWEEPARENLTAELSHLRSRLAALRGTGETPVTAEPTSPTGPTPTSWPARTPAGRPEARPTPQGGSRTGRSAVPAMERADGTSPDLTREAAARPGQAAAPPTSPTAARPSAGTPPDSGTGRSGDAPPPQRVAPAVPAPDRGADPAPRPAEESESDRALSGIEREPDFELRRRARSKRRREQAAAQLRDEATDSPGSLFRPPPKLPRS